MTAQQNQPHVDRPVPPARWLRLRLKPKAPETGYVDGAWWPRGGDLATELPDLLAELSIRLGPIHRVIYHLDEWAHPPARLTTGGRHVRLDGYRYGTAHTLTVHGIDGGGIVLLVVAPDTPADQAHATMTAAAAPDNAATVDDLRTISPPTNPNHHENGTAEQRWDSDGGTVLTRPDNQVHAPRS